MEKNSTLISLILIIAVFAIIIIASKTTTGNDENTNTYTPQSQIMQEYMAALNGNEEKLVYVWRPTCGYCVQFKPILEEVIKENNLTYVSVDTDALGEASAADFNYFLKSNDYLKNEQWGTPLLIVVKEGKVIADSQGYKEKAALISFFKSIGMINE